MAPQNQQGVSVQMGAVLNQLHERYGKIIAQIMQENAELQAAVDQQSVELDEHRSRALAQQSAPRGPSVPWPAAQPDPGGYFTHAEPGDELGGMAPVAEPYSPA